MLLAAETVHGDVAAFDERLAAVATKQGLRVVS
jgi:hypothetical protein